MHTITCYELRIQLTLEVVLVGLNNKISEQIRHQIYQLLHKHAPPHTHTHIHTHEREHTLINRHIQIYV